MKESHNYVVSLPDEAFSAPVLVDEFRATLQETQVSVTPTNRHGVYTLQSERATVPIMVESDGIDHIAVHFRGYTYSARVLRDTHHRLVAVLEASPAMQTRVLKVTAPMPGLLKSICIAEGQHVSKGQALFTLEAMKMENVISSPHAGVVKHVTARDGYAVEKGAPLCVIEPN
jgi:biotin carboxyl carrier protein